MEVENLRFWKQSLLLTASTQRVERRTIHFPHTTPHSELCEAMTISKGYRRPKFGYFLRAESFYNVATKEIDYSDDDHPSKGYHQKSHGESFLAIAQDYMGADGVYIF